MFKKRKHVRDYHENSAFANFFTLRTHSTNPYLQITRSSINEVIKKKRRKKKHSKNGGIREKRA